MVMISLRTKVIILFCTVAFAKLNFALNSHFPFAFAQLLPPPSVKNKQKTKKRGQLLKFNTRLGRLGRLETPTLAMAYNPTYPSKPSGGCWVGLGFGLLTRLGIYLGNSLANYGASRLRPITLQPSRLGLTLAK